jgi:hypothetical protein
MKKLSMLMVVILSVFATACQEEVTDEMISESNFADQGNVKKKNTSARYLTMPIAIFHRNSKLVYEPRLRREVCMPAAPTDTCIEWTVTEVEIPDQWNPCFLPCGLDIEFLDPWIIYEKFGPEIFESVRDVLKLKIDPTVMSVPISINSVVFALQFYDKNSLESGDPEPQPNIQFNHSLRIDAYVAQELGLKGNVIPAGKYPVMINEKNGTFNVILAVKEGFSN